MKRWHDTLTRLGIVLLRQPGLPWCHLGREGYTINVPPGLQDELAEIVIRHELQHALAGDCLPGKTEELGCTRYELNLVADAIINASLPAELLREAARAVYGPEGRPVTLDGLGWDRPYTPSRRELLEYLRKQQQTQPALPDEHELRHDEDADPRDLEAAHRQTVQRATEMAARDAMAQNAPPPPSKEAVRLERMLDAAVRRLEHAAYRHGSYRMTVRGWARPGRTPELRGWYRAPRMRLAALLDVSGSMERYHGLMCGLAARLLARRDCIVVLWDDRARVVASAAELRRISYGGGTVLTPAVEAARDADAAVIVTDGDIADDTVHIPWPAVWIITGGGEMPERRIRSRWRPIVVRWEGT